LQTTIYLAGIGTVIGHCFPITYLIAIFKFKFDLKKCDLYKGGKGVASTGGLLFAISP
jgi:glycerol-3-phosphate acyltransferase PlsY